MKKSFFSKYGNKLSKIFFKKQPTNPPNISKFFVLEVFHKKKLFFKED
jgi:hypothetical protein